MLSGNSNGYLYVPYLYFALTNAIPVAFGAYLVTYIEVNTSSGDSIVIKPECIVFINSLLLPEVECRWLKYLKIQFSIKFIIGVNITFFCQHFLGISEWN